MTSDRSFVRFLRHPAYLSTVGVLLLIYGAVGGNVLALLGAACCLYLAWHLGLQGAPASDGGGDRFLERYPPGMRRVVQVALLIGLIWGGAQAFWRLVELGWDRLFALGAAGGIVGLIGAVLWLAIRGLMSRRTI
jgi:hypothetical protein